jgi:hypothetical protein
VREIVDLYGSRGFDVLCITDHTVRTDDPWFDPSEWPNRGVGGDRHSTCVAEVTWEARRARALYELLVLPGVELTFNDRDPDQAAHAVAVGLTRFVSVDDGIAAAMETARAVGAALIAAHPFDDEPWANGSRLTRRFAADPTLRSSRGTRSCGQAFAGRPGCGSSSRSGRSASASSTAGSRRDGRRAGAGLPGPRGRLAMLLGVLLGHEAPGEGVAILSSARGLRLVLDLLCHRWALRSGRVRWNVAAQASSVGACRSLSGTVS